jgi:hypothetical protein
MRNITEERRSHLNVGGSLKSSTIFTNFLQYVSLPAEVEGKILNPATDVGKVSGITSVSLYSCFRNNDLSFDMYMS